MAMNNSCPMNSRIRFDRVCWVAWLVVGIAWAFASDNVPRLSAQTVALNRAKIAASTTPVSGQWTFNEHIAPIIYRHCAGCHRPDQVGPFALLEYEQVKRRAKTIKAVVDSGYMPPWHPSSQSPEFADTRQLSDADRKTLLEWIEQGAPQGEPKDKTPLPKFETEWMLGPPDLIVNMPQSFDIPADGPDIYRSFVFPVNLPEDRWIKAIELRPQARSAVHHALFFVDAERQARLRDGRDGQAGIPGMGFLNVGGGEGLGNNRNGAGQALINGLLNRQGGAGNNSIVEALSRGLGGYVPGTTPARLPGDLALLLPAGSDIIMQTHFHPTGKAAREQAQLGLYFADTPPSKLLVPIQVPAMFGFGAQIDIPAGESNYRVEDQFELPIAVEAITVGGHAHYLCREMRITATLPDGNKTLLLEINDWDLDWQDRYTFASPIVLPAGTQLQTELIYDNSPANPRNPYSPPRRIRWGRESNDEMGSMTLQVVAHNESEREQLTEALGQYINRTLFQKFSPGQSIGDRILQLDENKDGMLDREEAPPRLAGKVFDRLDSNSDNRLDKTELERLRQLTRQLGLPWDNSKRERDRQ